MLRGSESEKIDMILPESRGGFDVPGRTSENRTATEVALPLKASHGTVLRIRTMLLSRASPSTGYVPDYSFGRIHYFCNGLSAKTDKEKTKVIIRLDKGLCK